MYKKKIIVISAPSCSGKNTIFNEIRKKYPHIKQTISDTTRKIRNAEKSGIDYNYISENEFLQNIKNDVYLEHNYYNGHYYGTPIFQVEKLLESNEPFAMIIDVNGALKIKELFGDSVIMIFIMPPSIYEIRNRMVLRRENTDEEINQRLEIASFEITQSDKYDFCVINNELSDASRKVIEIIERGVFCVEN